MTTPAGAPFAIDKPYPGLRPFESHEALLFRGRDEHTNALLDRLSSQRFLAVVGTSGSGKSSLVRAGLLPALYRGYLAGASSRWRIAVMRPGNEPLAELARALSPPDGAVADRLSLLAELARTSLGLAAVARRISDGGGENVLLVVDQFEELFRFERLADARDGRAEATLFVRSLLEAADATDSRVYVVITIRSDFLGHCARFSGLPEALNQGQYLVPYLTREQRQEAIEVPARLAGARIAPMLVQRLLNDLGDDPAQLPVLQHALMRTFGMRASGETEIEFRHYEAVGGVASALDQHANSVMVALPPDSARHVAQLYKCLTTVENGRPVRRPARLDRIVDVLGLSRDLAAQAELTAAIRTFAAPEHSLLMCSTGSDLSSASVIDISHESLIKNWQRLNGWLTDEVRSVEWYRSVSDDCRRFRDHDASPWRDPELAKALSLKANGWNPAWAAQYALEGGPSFADVERFLATSVTAQDQERAQAFAARRREKRMYLGLMGVLLLLLVATASGAFFYWRAVQSEQALKASELDRTAEALRHAAELNTLNQQAAQTSAELSSKEAALREAVASGGATDELRRQVEDLRRQNGELAVAKTNSQRQLDGSTQAISVESRAALAQIVDLQAQLKTMRTKRDDLQSKIDEYTALQGTQVRDAGYWRSRWEEVDGQLRRTDAQLQQLRTQSAAAATAALPPNIVSLPQYSAVRLNGAPFAGRVVLVLGDLGRLTSSVARLYVAIPKEIDDASLFTADQKRAKDFLADLDPDFGPKKGCEGYRAVPDGTVWCFAVRKDKTLAETQLLGQFRYGPATYSVVATGWALNARGGVDVMSLVIYQSPPTTER